MNKKIHNNLSIENLIKTEWFNQFDVFQKHQITLGIHSNVDALIYAKPEFNYSQMNQIREGLVDNLDIFIYAKKEFNAEEMEQIRLGLKNNLDISLICENFDNSHKSCYYNFFRMPPPSLFKIFFKQQKKYSKKSTFYFSFNSG